jgi:hypothetical protein
VAIRKGKQEQAIESWMLTVAENGGVERFDDLHIDAIDDDWKPRKQWIEAGIQAYLIALDLRDAHELPFVVSLVFSLEGGGQRRGVDFQTKQALQQRLNHSPPSLLLFHRGKEPWIEMKRAASDALVQNLAFALLDGPELVGNVYYLEFRPSGVDEYHRSVFVAG